MPFPVSSALAGHMSTRFRQKVIENSSSPQVSSDVRICASETRKSNSVSPST